MARATPGSNDLIAQAEILKSHLRYAQIRAMNDTVPWGIRIPDAGSYLLYRNNAQATSLLPGENAAWWWIMILAMNLNSIMKQVALGKSWVSRRMKAIWFSFINIPGRIVKRSRELIVRLVKGHPARELYLEARHRIREMVPVPR